MGLSRYANARDANEKPIIDGLRGMGATVWQLDKPLDLIVGWRGQNWLFEVKLPPGPKGGTSHSRRTKGQVEFFATWRGQKDEIRSLDDALRIMGAIAPV